MLYFLCREIGRIHSHKGGHVGPCEHLPFHGDCFFQCIGRIAQKQRMHAARALVAADENNV